MFYETSNDWSETLKYGISIYIYISYIPVKPYFQGYRRDINVIHRTQSIYVFEVWYKYCGWLTLHLIDLSQYHNTVVRKINIHLEKIQSVCCFKARKSATLNNSRSETWLTASNCYTSRLPTKSTTESQLVPVHCPGHFISISTEHNCSAGSSSSKSCINLANLLACHVFYKNQLPRSTLGFSKYPFTFLGIWLSYRLSITVQQH